MFASREGAVIVALACFMAGCDLETVIITDPDILGTIEGQVTVAGSAGLSGVKVRLSGVYVDSTVTDGGGSYSFQRVAGGAYTISVSGLPAEATFSALQQSVTVSTNGESVTVDFSGTVDAGIVLETATMGASSMGGGYALGGTPNAILGARFSVTLKTQITAIGGHFNTYGGGNLSNIGSIWGAVISMPDVLPNINARDIEANAIASAVFQDGNPASGDLREAVSVVIEPGNYALLIGGGGLFNTTGSGVMAHLDQVALPGASFFQWDGRPGYDRWWDGIGSFVGPTGTPRFVVEGFPLPK